MCCRVLLPRRMLQEEGVAVEWECDQQEDPVAADASQQRLAFAPVGGAGSAAAETHGSQRHSYFRLRKMQRLMTEAF